MSRLKRNLMMTAGSVLLFALFAIAGWAIAPRFSSSTPQSSTTPWATAEFIEVEDGVRVPVNAVASYPIIPAGDETEAQAAARTRELAATTNYLTESDVVSEELGDPAAGGQVFILTEDVDRSSSDADAVEPIVVDTDDLLAAAGLPDEVPVEVLESAPLPLPLVEELTADLDLGLDGLLALDICAGTIPGALTPLGCPTGGFGGTIVPISLNVLDPVRITLGAPYVFPECVSDDTTFRMRVITNRPGTLTSIMWNVGPGTGNSLRRQPPDAMITRGATPPALDTQWYGQLDDASATTPRIKFCMEVPIRVDQGSVFHIVLFTSTYEPDDEPLTDDTAGFLYTGSVERRKPPTRLSSAGRDTLYVSAFRDSSQGTRTVVQARRRFPVWPSEPSAESEIEGCDPTYDGATPTVPTRLGTQGILTDSYSFDTSGGPERWFWGSEWDTMDVFALPLNGAIGYSVCIYELDASYRVVYAEAADVWVPGTRHVRATVEGFQTLNISPIPVISSVKFDAAAQSQCRPYTAAWPGPNLVLVDIGSAPEICVFQHVDGLRSNGGFFLDTSLIREGGEVDAVRQWISIPRSDLRRLVDTTDEYLVTVPLPSVSIGGTESRSGQATLKISIGPVGGVDEWRFGIPFPFIDR